MRKQKVKNKEICWLCFSISDLLRCPPTLKFHAVFAHRVSALLYAYCICDETKEYIQFTVETEDPNSKQCPWRIFKIGNRSVHFHGSYQEINGGVTSVQVVPVLIDTGMGTHVDFFAHLINHRCELRVPIRRYAHLRIERIRRVDIPESQDMPQIEHEGREDSEKGRYRCRYISALISWPNHHLLESHDSGKNDTAYFSAIDSLYHLDIVSKLEDIISVIFPTTGLQQPHLPLYCVDRIVSFFSIEDILRLLHYGLPSKNDFDSQGLKEDIFHSLSKSLISDQLENVFCRAEST